MASRPPDGQGQEQPIYTFPSDTRALVTLERLPGRENAQLHQHAYQLVRYGLLGQRVPLAELTRADLLQLGLVCAAETRGKRIYP